MHSDSILDSSFRAKGVVNLFTCWTRKGTHNLFIWRVNIVWYCCEEEIVIFFFVRSTLFEDHHVSLYQNSMNPVMITSPILSSHTDSIFPGQNPVPLPLFSSYHFTSCAKTTLALSVFSNSRIFAICASASTLFTCMQNSG